MTVGSWVNSSSEVPAIVKSDRVEMDDPGTASVSGVAVGSGGGDWGVRGSSRSGLMRVIRAHINWFWFPGREYRWRREALPATLPQCYHLLRVRVSPVVVCFPSARYAPVLVPLSPNRDCSGP